MVHQLDIEIPGSEDLSELRSSRTCLVVRTHSDPGLDLATGATCSADQSLRVSRKEVTIYTRLVIEAFER